MNTKTEQSQALTLAWGLLILLAMIWGSSFILMKKSILVFNGVEIGFLRVFFAGFVLIPFIRTAWKAIPSKDRGKAISTGFLGSFAPAILFGVAAAGTDSGLLGVMPATNPMFTLIFGALLFSQTITKSQVIGIVLGLAGVCALLFGGKADTMEISFNAYLMLGVIGAMLYAFNTLIIRFYLGHVKPLNITAMSLVAYVPFALVYLLWQGAFSRTELPEYWMALMSVFLLGAMGSSVALFLFNRLIQLKGAVFSSSVTYLIPIVALIWGLLDGEILIWIHFIGIGLILAGVIALNRSKM